MGKGHSHERLNIAEETALGLGSNEDVYASADDTLLGGRKKKKKPGHKKPRCKGKTTKKKKKKLKASSGLAADRAAAPSALDLLLGPESLGGDEYDPGLGTTEAIECIPEKQDGASTTESPSFICKIWCIHPEGPEKQEDPETTTVPPPPPDCNTNTNCPQNKHDDDVIMGYCHVRCRFQN